MPKLELPADVADKVVAMLKPRVRPMCVMIFKEGKDHERASHERNIQMRAGTLSEDELSFLVGERPIITWDQSKTLEFTGKHAFEDYIIKREGKGILELNLHYASVMDKSRTAAILLGFQYRAKKEGDIKDVMYRDAYHAMGEIV